MRLVFFGNDAIVCCSHERLQPNYLNLVSGTSIAFGRLLPVTRGSSRPKAVKSLNACSNLEFSVVLKAYLQIHQVIVFGL